MSQDLKKQLVRLGAQRPDLRKHLRPILAHLRDRVSVNVPRNLKWHTPPRNQGQIVEVSYATDPNADPFLWRKTYDKSDNSWVIDRVDLDYYELWEEMKGWEPWNSVPRFVPRNAWEKVEEDQSE